VLTIRDPARIVTSLLRLAGAILLAGALAAPARADDSGPMILHLLDYIAVDYAGAVDDGRIKSEDEYKEMTEFAGQVLALVKGLPANAERARLEGGALAITRLVARKADAKEVADGARGLRDAVVRAYGIAVAPRHMPDVSAAPLLYAEHCASCHGVLGAGNGPAAKGMQPPPANFLDRERMVRRSAFSLYNSISLGVSGTAMPSFKQMDEGERWALAFHVAGFATPADVRQHGEALWKSGHGRDEFASVVPVATLSEQEVRKRHGADGAALQAYLLARPGVLAEVRQSPLAFSSAKLAESVAAYRKGDGERATQLAIQSYLEGFELVEHQLAAIDASLMSRTERAMMAYREQVQSGAPLVKVERQAAEVQGLLTQAREKIGSTALSPQGTFSAALVILVREGLEAVLVLAAILAFVSKVGHGAARRYVHLGWIAALVLGAATWFASSKLIAISGADREVTEGVTALVAAAILLYVGFWLHDKTRAAAWQAFIKERVGGSIAQGTVWTLALVSFLAVYRELFETILFYQALAAQAGPEGHGALLAGVAVGALLLIALTWAILRWSARIPLGPFFGASAVLMAVLAVVFTGQGVAALQEAGWIDARAVALPRVPMLGIFPTLQTLGAQAVVASAIIAALWWAKRSPK
jgi:high-affinity iron transporter